MSKGRHLNEFDLKQIINLKAWLNKRLFKKLRFFQDVIKVEESKVIFLL
jgi:hypothetical protein